MAKDGKTLWLATATGIVRADADVKAREATRTQRFVGRLERAVTWIAVAGDVVVARDRAHTLLAVDLKQREPLWRRPRAGRSTPVVGVAGGEVWIYEEKRCAVAAFRKVGREMGVLGG